MRPLTSSIILVLCLLAGSTTVVAQNATLTGELGLRFTKIKTGSSHQDAGGIKLGSIFGVKLGYSGSGSDNFQWLLGLQYLGGHGGWIKFDSADVHLPNTFPSDTVEANKKVKIKSSYLAIPIGFKIQTNEAQNLRFFAEAIPFTLAFRMGTKVSIPDYNVKNVKARKESKLFAWFYEYNIGATYTLSDTGSASFALGWIGSYNDLLKAPGKQKLGGFQIKLGYNFY